MSQRRRKLKGRKFASRIAVHERRLHFLIFRPSSRWRDRAPSSRCLADFSLLELKLTESRTFRLSVISSFLALPHLSSIFEKTRLVEWTERQIKERRALLFFLFFFNCNNNSELVDRINGNCNRICGRRDWNRNLIMVTNDNDVFREIITIFKRGNSEYTVLQYFDHKMTRL